MNPADKRLAVRPEDHPLQYAKFEGVIPPGQIRSRNGGTWESTNHWKNQPLEEQLVRGKIHIVLLGEKLRGGFTLVQIERRSISFSRSDYLLLIKSRDEYADPSWDIESLRFDCSVFTGREIPGLAGAVSEWVPLMLVDAAPPIGASIREHGLEAYRKICPRRAAAVFLPIWTRVSPSRISCADVDDDQGGRDRFGY
jgi:hypothetical protein